MAGRAKSMAVPEGGFQRIAVLRLSSLGDVVLTLPVVAALRRAWPGATLHYWVKEEYAALLARDPRVDHVRELEKDARRIEDLVSMSAELESCDLIVDLHGNSRTRVLTFRQKAPVLRASSYRLRRARWVHARWTAPPPVPNAVERYGEALAPLGLAPEGVPVVHAGEAAERWAGDWLAAQRLPGAPVALCPGARHATKQWPESHWLALDHRLAAEGRARLWFSTAAERRALPALAAAVEADAASRWVQEPLDRVAALLGHARGVVSNDSGLMHLAAARGRRVVALFGSTSPVLGFAPAGEGHEVLCRNEPCQPCTLHGRDSCPRGHFRCMRELTAEQVHAALGACLQREAAGS